MPQRPYDASNQEAEQAYRAAFQRGASTVLDALRHGVTDEIYARMKVWIEVDLAQWRRKDYGCQTPEAPPPPPEISGEGSPPA